MADIDKQESDFARRVRQVPFDDAPQAEHAEALRERALAAFDSESESPSGPRWKRAIQQGRSIMRRPIPRVIAATAACLSIAVVWLLAPGGHSTAQAFNMFAEAIVAAKSASFTMDVSVEGQQEQSFKCYYLAPAKYRNEIRNNVTIADFDGRKFVTLMPEEKRMVVMNMKNLPAEGDKKQTMDLFGRLRELLGDAHEAKGGEYESMGEKEIDGHRAVGFRHATPLAAVTMWGDPKTGMPLLVETSWSGIPRTEATMKRFQLDVELPPELFDTTPPDGYQVQSFDVDASQITEADLLKAFRAATDASGGEFLDGMDMPSVTRLLANTMLAGQANKKRDVTPQVMQLSMTIGRGISFAVQLPNTAEAHYAGKGVKIGEPGRPIFWYKPEGAKQYRVIYADLSIKDEVQAPDVPGAVRLKNPAAAKPAEPK